MEENKKRYIRVERYKWPDEIAQEKKQTRKKFLIACGFVLCFLCGIGISYLGNSGAVVSVDKETDKWNQIYDIMRNKWYFGKDIKDLDKFLMNNAINGLTVNEYDVHTNYLEEDRASNYLTQLEGSLVGIGVSYLKIEDSAVIDRVYIDSPAKKAGVKEGDQILKVNGISVSGKSTDEVGELVRGEEGTTLTMEFLRNGEIIKKDLVRAPVNTSVYGYVKENTGILDFDRFTEHSAEEFESYLEDFKDQGVNSLIIDMRDNPGGYLNTMIDVASFFLDEDTLILQEEDRYGEITNHYTRESKQYHYDTMVVLVNDQTASAAEALAAALKEQGDVSVVGVTTYGKGTVQEPVIFKDGSYLKYTIAEWLTPKGKKINKVGIAPDIEVELLNVIYYELVNDEKDYGVDNVSASIIDAQVLLDFLGYDVDRMDGYFSQKTEDALKAWQREEGLNVDGIINVEVNQKILMSAVEKWYQNEEVMDTQMIKALEVANGR